MVGNGKLDFVGFGYYIVNHWNYPNILIKIIKIKIQK